MVKIFNQSIIMEWQEFISCIQQFLLNIKIVILLIFTRTISFFTNIIPLPSLE